MVENFWAERGKGQNAGGFPSVMSLRARAKTGGYPNTQGQAIAHMHTQQDIPKQTHTINHTCMIRITSRDSTQNSTTRHTTPILRFIAQ